MRWWKKGRRPALGGTGTERLEVQGRLRDRYTAEESCWETELTSEVQQM